MKAKLFAICMAFAVLSVSSCSNDELSENISSKNENATDIKELTNRLKAMPGYHDFEEETTMCTRSGISMRDCGKIALADVSGAIRGYKVWKVPGALLGAVAFSLYKTCNVLSGNSMLATMPDSAYLAICNNRTNGFEFCDSIGYFHNLAEHALYNSNSNSHLLNPIALVGNANTTLRTLSNTYASTQITFYQQYTISRASGNIHFDDTDMSFSQYYSEICNKFPDDVDELEFLAQYIYNLYYSNYDAEEYTTDILQLLDNSNMDYDEIEALRVSVLVGYSSMLYSDNLECTYTNQ